MLCNSKRIILLKAYTILRNRMYATYMWHIRVCDIHATGTSIYARTALGSDTSTLLADQKQQHAEGLCSCDAGVNAVAGVPCNAQRDALTNARLNRSRSKKTTYSSNSKRKKSAL